MYQSKKHLLLYISLDSKKKRTVGNVENKDAHVANTAL